MCFKNAFYDCCVSNIAWIVFACYVFLERKRRYKEDKKDLDLLRVECQLRVEYLHTCRQLARSLINQKKIKKNWLIQLKEKNSQRMAQGVLKVIELVLTNRFYCQNNFSDFFAFI